jgi:hypothetical protein
MVDQETAEIARRGRLLYEQRLKETLEREHWSKFLAIEPDSGDYFLGETLSEAMQLARRAHPGRMSFGMRIGSGIQTGLLLISRD